MSSLSDLFNKHQAQTSPFPMGIEVESASGSRIFDTSGKSYIDMIAGVAVNNIGHRHPEVIRAVQEQLEKHLHVMVYGEYIQESPALFARELTKLLPRELDRVYFVNSGTEANEAALKLAKRVTGRTELIACQKSYHGSTHGSLSVSGNEAKKSAFRPLLPDVRFIEHNNRAHLDRITEKTAGVIIEVIQGDGGVRIADLEYLKALRERCSATGARLIFDEIQTGFGRTGKLFAFEHYGVVPDILTAGKAIAGGMPMGAMIGSDRDMKTFTYDPVLGHITSFGGHPVSCAAGVATLRILRDEIDFEEVERKGIFIRSELEKCDVEAIRGKGLMLAVDMKSSDDVQKVFEYCLKRGVLIFWFLSHPHSFRLSPPLNISYEDLNEALEVISEGIECLS